MRASIIALITFVAAWMPVTAAHAVIGPEQLEALDRQGATEIVVRREPGLSAAERADVRAGADVTFKRASTLADTELVRADSGGLAEAVAELNRDPDVVYAEPVTVQTAQGADPYYGSLWGLENVGQRMFLPGSSSYYPAGTPDADMDVPEAWAKATGAGVTVGIVDTGLTATHPDLVNQLATNAGETGTDSLGRDKRSNGVDDDGNGYRDDWRGWDFVSENAGMGVSEGDSTAGPDNDPQDNHGHGTHVAGTIAAQRDNDEGISGVAPGAKIMSLRGLGANGRGSSLAIAEAFDYAGKLGLRIDGLVIALRRPGHQRAGRRRGAQQRRDGAAQRPGRDARRGHAVGRRARQRGQAQVGSEGRPAPGGRRQGQARRVGLPRHGQRRLRAAALQRQGHAAQGGHAAPPRLDGRERARRRDPRPEVARGNRVPNARTGCIDRRTGRSPTTRRTE